jgi:coproporphyrinogen III oxidase-like Fe-S oxidoreductase
MSMQLLIRAAAALVGLAGRRLMRMDAAGDWNPRPGSGRTPALYVHIPFCAAPCDFCAFHRFAFREAPARAYHAALRRELELLFEAGFSFSEVYIGGGTPTILPDELERLLELLQRRQPDLPVSLETYPADVTAELLDLLVRCRVERLSVGVQSFDARLLRILGRDGLPPDELRRRLASARGRFPTLQLDLLYNHPAQTAAVLRRDIAAAVATGVDQITFNPLMPPLVRGGERGPALEPDLGRADDLYRVIDEELNGRGWRSVTSWCYAAGAGTRAEYLVDSPEYLAAGCGAVGYYDGVFHHNTFNLRRYGELLAEDRTAVVRRRAAAPWEREAYLLLGFLFGGGGSTTALRRRLGAAPSRRVRLAGALWHLLGLNGSRPWDVGPRGRRLVNAMMQRFFGAQTRLRARALAADL